MNHSMASPAKSSAMFLWIASILVTLSALLASMAARIGSPATTNCEPRQARKGAAAAVASGAGVRLVRVATLLTRSG